MGAVPRRDFLADVGRGMLLASVGAATAHDLGLVGKLAFAEEGAARLQFGALEPLVGWLQETTPDKLLPEAVAKLKSGTSLETLITAGALANARAFGGEDYTGYHTFMALLPAYEMSRELPTDQQPLPVLKVLHRNCRRVHEQNVHHQDRLHPVAAAVFKDAGITGAALNEAVHAVNWDEAEAQFAALAAHSPEAAYQQLLTTVQEDINVHRIVLAWRSWAMLGLTGQDHAHTLLRQSVRFCLQTEQYLKDRDQSGSAIRQVLPKLLDQYSLLSKSTGTKPGDAAWLNELAKTIYGASCDQAAEAVAMALAEGYDPEHVGEAISLASNMLVLHDPGRRAENSSAEKPAGCVHGDSVGVHASDSANAWRNISRVGNARNRVASLIVGAYHTAGQTSWSRPEPFITADEVAQLTATDEKTLLGQAEEAISGNDQRRASIVVQKYGDLNLPPRPLFDVLLKYAISEDGALHAEKYYRTVQEEFATTRPEFRWRQVTALARVTASEYGFAAPGYAESRELLGLA